MMRRLLALLALLVPCVACDQVTKVMAVDQLKGHPPTIYLDGLLRLTYAENPGAFLGLGRSLPDAARLAIFSGLVAVFLIAASVWIVRRPLPRAVFLGVGLLVAGGVGNLIDRVSRPGHRVVDFVQMRAPAPLAKLQTGVFNVADVYVVIGAVLLIVPMWRTRHEDDDQPPNTESAPTTA